MIGLYIAVALLAVAVIMTAHTVRRLNAQMLEMSRMLGMLIQAGGLSWEAISLLALDKSKPPTDTQQ